MASVFQGVLITAFVPPSTPYVLAYSLPLLLISIPYTFLGAYLTLDRTRSFAPIDRHNPEPEDDPIDDLRDRIAGMLQSYRSNGVRSSPLRGLYGGRHAHKREEKITGTKWRFGGGVGGIMAGWLCGVHISTYLALLITNRAHAKLGPVQFLVIWMLSSIPLTIAGARWKFAALTFAAVTGGASFTGLVSIIFYPSLTARLIVAAVFVIILMLGCLLPLPRVQHWTLRVCTSLTGAIGIVVSIALMKSSRDTPSSDDVVGSWANVWLVLAVRETVGRRGSTEKGLSAAMALFSVSGVVTDWMMKRTFGENPDKEWDKYLAEYSRSLPFEGDRQGTFQPFRSFWSKIFPSRASRDQDQAAVLFPSESTLAPCTSDSLSSTLSPTSLKSLPSAPTFQPIPSRKPSSKSILVKTKPLGVVDYSEDDLSSSEDEKKHGQRTSLGEPPKFRPYLPKRSSTANTGMTLVGGLTPVLEKPGFGITMGATTVEEYTDEEDVTSALKPVPIAEKSQERGWRPGFLRKHEEAKRRSLSGNDYSSSPKSSESGNTRESSTSTGNPNITGMPRSSSPDQMSEASSRHSKAKLDTHVPSPLSSKPIFPQNTIVSSNTSLSLLPQGTLLPPISAPATPSLIKAIERINLASQVNNGGLNSPGPMQGKPEVLASRRQSRDALSPRFWDDVRSNAAKPTSST